MIVCKLKENIQCIILREAFHHTYKFKTFFNRFHFEMLDGSLYVFVLFVQIV